MRAMRAASVCAIAFAVACTQDLRVLDREPQMMPSEMDCSCKEPFLCAVEECVNSSGVTQIGVGYRHVCRVADGALSCWGENRQSQLGLSDVETREAPERVGDGSSWLQVSASEEHTCAIASPGRLYCWGYNRAGQLGTRDTAPQRLPTRVQGHDDWVRVFCGGDSSCALRASGALYCWGDTARLFAGPGDVQPDDMLPPDIVDSPIAVAPELEWIDVSHGQDHVCGVTDEGALVCWGKNEDGQLGTGMTSMSPRLPSTLEGTGWQRVAAGQHHTCAIRQGELYCWGRGDSGELGLGNGQRRTTSPVRVGDDDDWDKVAVGVSHSCAIKRNGRLYCWGRNSDAQLAQPPVESIPNPTLVHQRMRFSKVAAGAQHTCAVDSGLTMYCWGVNNQGQLGLGDTMSRYTPTALE